MDETFIEIPELQGYYINRAGAVFSTKSNKLLKPYLEKSGYYRYYFNVDNVQIKVLLHRLLANVFLNLPSIYSELEVDHIDTNRTNNAICNLQVLTKQDHFAKTCHDNGMVQHNYTYSIVCSVCGGPKCKSPIDSTCTFCYHTGRRKGWSDDKEEIRNLVNATSWTHAAKFYGISDNGLRKRYKSLGGDPKDLRT